MLDVNDVKSYNGRVEPDIALGNVGAIVVRSVLDTREMRFHAIEGFEELYDGLFICFCCGCKTGAVHAIVDVVVGPLIRLLDFLPQCFREEIHAFIFFGEQIIELLCYQPRLSSRRINL